MLGRHGMASDGDMRAAPNRENLGSRGPHSGGAKTAAAAIRLDLTAHPPVAIVMLYSVGAWRYR